MKIGKLYVHSHQISAHFTTALFPVAIFFLILYFFSHCDSFCTTYFNLMILATFSTPISYLTGIIDWKLKFRGARTSIFIKKIWYGWVLTAIGLLCITWYWLYPTVFSSPGVASTVFLILNVSIIPVVVYLGYLGGRLAFR